MPHSFAPEIILTISNTNISQSTRLCKPATSTRFQTAANKQEIRS